MYEALVHSPLRVTLHQIPIPAPKESEVLIKIEVSGSNPKDWKRPTAGEPYNGTNQGDDIAGVVVALGDNVTEFQPGDRVGAFHHLFTSGGSYAEYGIAHEFATFHIPAHVSFEEVATIPLAAMTAAVGVFLKLGIPEPWAASAYPERIPKGGIVVYGAASAVGAYAVQLAARAGVHPIIAVAGHGIPFVQGLLDRSLGDTVVDYRKGNESVVEAIKAAVPHREKLMHAFDAISEKAKSTIDNLSKVVSPDGNIVFLLPATEDPVLPKTLKRSFFMVTSVFGPDKDFGYVWLRLMGLGLKDGWFKAHPHTVIPGGLNGVEEGLRNLKEGKASATKYVFRIAETKELRQ